MTNETFDHIQSYLNDYGWSFQPASDTSILSGWQGEVRTFPLEIIVNPTWIQFKISPLVELEAGKRLPVNLLRHVLKLNASLKLAKISTNTNHILQLTMEILTSHLNYDDFCKALEILAYYADTLSADLHALERASHQCKKPKTHQLC